MQLRSENRYYRAFFEELARLGHVEGQTLEIERFGRETNTSGLEAMAAAVVRAAPDAVYVIGFGGLIFKRLTTTLPIVALTGDPVAIGLVASIARPGGNITGVSVDTGPTIHAKRIDLLRGLVPQMSKLAWLGIRNSPQAAVMPAAAEAFGLALAPFSLDLPTSEAAYRDAIAAITSSGADAIMVGDNPDALVNRALLVGLVSRSRLPAMYFLREFVEAGGLMAYSFDLVDLNRRAAIDVDAIFKGANPGDIPYYQSSKFELSLNLKTARDLGIAVPPLLLARADEVIE